MEIEPIPQKRTIREFLQLIPERISQTVENFFYQLGLKITKHPKVWIISSLIAVAACTIGFYRFRQEKNPLKLWVPPDSDFIRDTEWLISQFGEAQRQETMIMTGDDILTPEALYELNEITTRIIDVQTSHPQIAWTDVCFKVPVLSKVYKKEKRDVTNMDNDFFEEEPGERLNKSSFEPSVHTSRKTYCSIFNSFQRGCLLLSILDIWELDSELIKSQSKEDIVRKLNSTQISPTLGHPINYTELLGGITRDNLGRIISARAVKTEFVTHVNFSNVNMEKIGNEAGTADWATNDILMWESAFLQDLEESKKLLEENGKNNSLRLWYEAGRSFGDISSSTMFQDADKLTIGILLMFLYVQIILSKFNWVEWRYLLSTVALLCIGAAFVAAIGICSFFGVPYGPVHNSLPFMLMGLGVDDTFVMAASWEQVLTQKINHDKPLPERVALMLSHAGSAICITSLTDVVAFIIGTSTILPCLQSFCIYAAVGVLITFLLQVTIFVAFFMMDAKRIEKKRNGAFPCIVHANYQPPELGSKHTISWNFIDRIYSKFILTRPGKVIILVSTIALASFGSLGSYKLEQWFDPMWFLPEGSHLSDYIQVRNREFPERGQPGFIFLSQVDIPDNFPELINLVEKLKNLTHIESVRSWPHELAEFVDIYYEKDMKTRIESEEFYFYLSKFLFSQKGGKYQSNFRFAGNLTCGENTPDILIASVDFSFRKFSTPYEWIPAMDESKKIVSESTIHGSKIVWSKMFASWITDKVIAQEVSRNILLALICVMGMTTLLIAELQTCFWILLCVLLTLLDVCGFMFYWGLTIDIVSCIGLELAVGLSVDYAAHVAHAFLIAESQNVKLNRRSRVLTAVRHIGAAVTYGAGSTLLALSLLVFSRAYVFQSFFKIFLLVIVFGLWHGLLLLPVILSTIGPPSLVKTLQVEERELQTIKESVQEDGVLLNKS